MSRNLVIGGVLVLFLIVPALLAGLAGHDPYQQDLGNKLRPPYPLKGSDPRHLLGTDDFGRDILSRLLYGARMSLSIALLATLAAGAAGVNAGACAGYYGGRVEALLMRAADVQQAVPAVLLAITVVAVFGNSLSNLVVVLAISGWVDFARIVHGTVRSLRERDFVLAATALGCTDLQILFRHILANAWSPVLVTGTVQMARVMIIEASLSFLGLGIQPPAPAWGTMLNDGRMYMYLSPWLATLPGIAIGIAVFSVNLLGDGLRQALDPKSRRM